MHRCRDQNNWSADIPENFECGADCISQLSRARRQPNDHFRINLFSNGEPNRLLKKSGVKDVVPAATI